MQSGPSGICLVLRARLPPCWLRNRHSHLVDYVGFPGGRHDLNIPDRPNVHCVYFQNTVDCQKLSNWSRFMSGGQFAPRADSAGGPRLP